MLLINGRRVSEMVKIAEKIISINDRFKINVASSESSTIGYNAKKNIKESKSIRKRLLCCTKIRYSRGRLCIIALIELNFTLSFLLATNLTRDSRYYTA